MRSPIWGLKVLPEELDRRKMLSDPTAIFVYLAALLGAVFWARFHSGYWKGIQMIKTGSTERRTGGPR